MDPHDSEKPRADHDATPQPVEDGPPEVVDAAMQEAEYPADESSEG